MFGYWWSQAVLCEVLVMCVSACKNCAPVTLKMQAAFLSIWLIPFFFSVKLEHGQRIIWCAQSSMLQWHTLKVVICIWEIGQCCPLGLEVWFLLRVQEVPGSIPGMDLLPCVLGARYNCHPIPGMDLLALCFGCGFNPPEWTFLPWVLVAWYNCCPGHHDIKSTTIAMLPLPVPVMFSLRWQEINQAVYLPPACRATRIDQSSNCICIFARSEWVCVL